MSFKITNNSRENLINLGLIIESEEISDEKLDDEIESEFKDAADAEVTNQFLDADYTLQNEIIKYFINNPNEDLEIFNQYAISIGVDPNEFQKQSNILLSQLLKIYLNDADDLGYGDSLVSDDIPEEIQKKLAKDTDEEEDED